MKVKIELNSKELDALVKKEEVQFDYEVDIYTESKSVSPEQELAIYSRLFWSLCTILPHTVIRDVFKAWNVVVEQLQKGLKKGEIRVKPPRSIVVEPEE